MVGHVPALARGLFGLCQIVAKGKIDRSGIALQRGKLLGPVQNNDAAAHDGDDFILAELAINGAGNLVGDAFVGEGHGLPDGAADAGTKRVRSGWAPVLPKR